MKRASPYLRAMLLPPCAVLRKLGVPLPERLFRHLHFQGPFSTRLPNGASLRLLSWGNRVENELYWRGWRGHEPELMPWWLHFARNGGDILDIGANTGVFAYAAKATAPQARVFAFEPVERIAARTRENGTVSGLDVTVVTAAMAEQTGTMELHDPGGANAYSASLEGDFLDAEKTSYNVPVLSVDQYSRDMALAPSLLKIDVEGAEARVLLGAEETLKRNIVVLCEWLGSGPQTRHAATLLSDLGYVALDPLTQAPRDLFAPSDMATRNLVILPKEQAEVMRNSCTSPYGL